MVIIARDQVNFLALVQLQFVKPFILVLRLKTFLKFYDIDIPEAQPSLVVG
jgi:hypothetical protein